MLTSEDLELNTKYLTSSSRVNIMHGAHTFQQLVSAEYNRKTVRKYRTVH